MTKMLTEEQKIEAAERGEHWGEQEAECQLLMAQSEEYVHRIAAWTTGQWCGALPHDSTDIYERTDEATADRDEYEAILDRSAKAAYEAAVEAAKVPVAPIIAAIEAGIAAGGDEQNWDSPEFEEARRLTGEAGMQWDFEGWEEVLESLVFRPSGKFGGVEVAR